MFKGKVIRDNLHRVVRIENNSGDARFTVEYVGDTGTPQRVSMYKDAMILTRNEDGTYTYKTKYVDETTIATDVTAHHLRGAISWNDPQQEKWCRDVYQEVSLDDERSGYEDGSAAFIMLVLLMFTPLGWVIVLPVLIGWTVEQRIKQIRRKRRLLMERAYNAFYKIKS